MSNDDGLSYPGIKTLIEVAREFGDVIVAAPQNHQSGKASSISIGEPLRVKKVKEEPGFTVYAISGEDYPEEILPIIGPADYDMNCLFVL